MTSNQSKEKPMSIRKQYVLVVVMIVVTAGSFVLWMALMIFGYKYSDTIQKLYEYRHIFAGLWLLLLFPTIILHHNLQNKKRDRNIKPK